MIDDQALTTSAIPPANSIRPLPAQVKAVAYGNLIVGPLLAILNAIVVGHSISELNARNAPEGLSTFFYLNILIYLVVGTLFLVGGIGLLRNQKWGRVVSLIAAVSCFVALFAGSVLGKIAQNLLASGALPLRPGQMSFYFRAPMSVAGFAPLYAIAVIVLLMLPDARNWARGDRDVAAVGGLSEPQSATPSPPGYQPNPNALSTVRTSPLAIVSLVCSMVPFMMLTQIASVVLGIVALTQIKKSNGALRGKGFAIAGIIISSVLIIFIATVIIFVTMVSNSH